jgi:hypothetical protein
MCRRLRSGQQQYCIDTSTDAYAGATFTSISTTVSF